MVEAEKEKNVFFKVAQSGFVISENYLMDATTLFRVLPDKDGVRKTSNYFLTYFRVL